MKKFELGLTPSQRQEFFALHKHERHARFADRLKTILLRDEGLCRSLSATSGL
jgi:hypothetical protein